MAIAAGAITAGIIGITVDTGGIDDALTRRGTTRIFAVRK